jgi:L-ascorbate metabolism protein UlaG (beta-lactamase superfamily)
MNQVEINLLGISAVRISDSQKTIYIDAFADCVPPFEVERADLILVTHDDGDHFLPDKTAQAARETGALIVGPPSIAYPLLADEKLPPEQLTIVYPVHFKQPVTLTVRGVKLKVYQTRHFVDWEPPHVSYLIEVNGHKIYMTGDTFVMDEDDPDLKDLDVLLCNLVTPQMEAAEPSECVSIVEAIQKTFEPRYLIPNHLLHCDWTVTPASFKEEAERRGLEGIVVIEDEKWTFKVPDKEITHERK